MPGAKQRILVVEDEPSILENITYALGRDGHAVAGCSSGGEALRLLGDQQFDLVVLDIGLPDCTGFDLFHDLRARSNVPVIFLTARSEELDRVVGLEMGADDYVTKPFSPRELSARVRAVLRRCSPSSESPENNTSEGTNPNLRIDEERACARYFGQEISLSSTEFRLLQALCRHPGRVYLISAN